MQFAIHIAVGPAPGEADKAADVIDSVLAYSSQLKWVILILDSSSTNKQTDRFTHITGPQLVLIDNPRRGMGPGHTGGLCVADLVALKYAQYETTADYLLKLDTDSLVIAPFEQRIEAALATLDSAGILGVVGDSFGENRRHEHLTCNGEVLDRLLCIGTGFQTLTPNERAVLAGIGVRDERHFQMFLRARAILHKAVARGYRLGEYCQGGGYVVSRALMDAMAASKSFSDPLIWQDIGVGEDVMMGISCGAAGLKMYDLSLHERVFAVTHECIQLSREQLAASEYSIIHSIRGSMEEEFRTYFRHRRAGRVQCSAEEAFRIHSRLTSD